MKKRQASRDTGTPRVEVANELETETRARIAARYIEEVGFLLCSVDAAHSGVEGTRLHFSHGEYSRTEVEHGPKLLVELLGGTPAESFADAVSVTLTEPPQILGTLPPDVVPKIVAFVASNRQVLLRAWHNEIDSMEALQQLTRLPRDDAPAAALKENS